MTEDSPPTKRVHGLRAWRTILTFAGYGAFLGALLAGSLGHPFAIPVLVAIFTVIGVIEGDDIKIVAQLAAVLFHGAPVTMAHSV